MSSARTEVRAISKLLAKALRRERKAADQMVGQEAKLLLEEAELGTAAAKSAAKPGASRSTKAKRPSALGRPSTRVRGANSVKEPDLMDVFDGDVDARLEVARARKALRPKDLTKRGLKVEQAQFAIAQSGKLIKKYYRFGLTKSQVLGLDELLGQYFGKAIRYSGSPARREAQAAANKALAKLKAHWDAALPPGKSMDDALRDVFHQLQAARRKNPKLNASKFVRKNLFAGWRTRFMQRLDDPTLRPLLEESTGLRINVSRTASGGKSVKFELPLKIGATTQTIGLDVDHGLEGLADAVGHATRWEDLKSVVDSDGLQLLLPKDNRRMIEALRKEDRRLWSAERQSAAAYRAAEGVSRATLDAEFSLGLSDILDKWVNVEGDF